MKRLKVFFGLMILFILVACSDDSSTVEEVEENMDNRFVSFQYLEVVTNDTTVVFTGDVSTSEEEIYYTINQGEDILIEEQTLEIQQSDEEWINFEIREELPSDVERASDTPPIIAIYGKTETGTEINPNYIPADLNMEVE